PVRGFDPREVAAMDRDRADDQSAPHGLPRRPIGDAADEAPRGWKDELRQLGAIVRDLDRQIALGAKARLVGARGELSPTGDRERRAQGMPKRVRLGLDPPDEVDAAKLLLRKTAS